MLVSVLFSEPKIPQCYPSLHSNKKFSRFQCSSASRKFLNHKLQSHNYLAAPVSVLFSEPKIPQSNEKMRRKFVIFCFSALQRAENSSMYPNRYLPTSVFVFQCSSASRKFLNTQRGIVKFFTVERFSALQRAENSSMKQFRSNVSLRGSVSVLFSEPKIPQLGVGLAVGDGVTVVSVLFSEPKIPQFKRYTAVPVALLTQFQCSSASRKFLNRCQSRRWQTVTVKFQCSSASRKFLNLARFSRR